MYIIAFFIFSIYGKLVAVAKGAIQLRVSQEGNEQYAQAEDLVLSINIEASNTTATHPITEEEHSSVRKMIHNGQLYILRNGMQYDACGRVVSAQ